MDQDLFRVYRAQLLEWNKKFNLTAITDPVEIEVKHFADSLLLLNILPLKNESVVDIGAGAGFPGLPLKIARPGLKLTLVEATRKKADFLRHLSSLLGLKEVEIVWERVEDYGRVKRECFDLAVVRAVASLNILCEYAFPLLKIGGLLVAYKEEQVEEELAQASHALKILGGQINAVKKIVIPGSTIVRSLVMIEKTGATPMKFPRRPGMAKKKPL